MGDFQKKAEKLVEDHRLTVLAAVDAYSSRECREFRMNRGWCMFQLGIF